MKKILSTSFLIITLIALSNTTLNATKVTINVKDTNGQNVIGASIMVKGTQLGGLTDSDGQVIMICPLLSVLSIKCLDYKSQEVTVNDTLINVVLELDNTLSLATYNFIDLNINRFNNFNYSNKLFINERKTFFFKTNKSFGTIDFDQFPKTQTFKIEFAGIINNFKNVIIAYETHKYTGSKI